MAGRGAARGARAVIKLGLSGLYEEKVFKYLDFLFSLRNLLRLDPAIPRGLPDGGLGPLLLIINLLRVGIGVFVKLAKLPPRFGPFGTGGSEGVNHLVLLDPFEGPVHVLRGNAFELGHREHSELGLVAQQVLAANKIIFVIEEGDSSQCNQAFDRHVAKHGKSLMRAALDIVFRHNVFGNHIDQYGLPLAAQQGVMKNIWRDIFPAMSMCHSCRLGHPLYL